MRSHNQTFNYVRDFCADKPILSCHFEYQVDKYPFVYVLWAFLFAHLGLPWFVYLVRWMFFRKIKRFNKTFIEQLLTPYYESRRQILLRTHALKAFRKAVRFKFASIHQNFLTKIVARVDFQESNNNIDERRSRRTKTVKTASGQPVQSQQHLGDETQPVNPFLALIRANKKEREEEKNKLQTKNKILPVPGLANNGIRNPHQRSSEQLMSGEKLDFRDKKLVSSNNLDNEMNLKQQIFRKSREASIHHLSRQHLGEKFHAEYSSEQQRVVMISNNPSNCEVDGVEFANVPARGQGNKQTTLNLSIPRQGKPPSRLDRRKSGTLFCPNIEELSRRMKQGLSGSNTQKAPPMGFRGRVGGRKKTKTGTQKILVAPQNQDVLEKINNRSNNSSAQSFGNIPDFLADDNNTKQRPSYNDAIKEEARSRENSDEEEEGFTTGVIETFTHRINYNKIIFRTTKKKGRNSKTLNID